MSCSINLSIPPVIELIDAAPLSSEKEGALLSSGTFGWMTSPTVLSPPVMPPLIVFLGCVLWQVQRY